MLLLQTCEEQTSENRQITMEIENIKTSAQQSLDSTTVVNEASGSLEEQVRLLIKAVGRFKLAGEINQRSADD